jgi:hypothetical protein
VEAVEAAQLLAQEFQPLQDLQEDSLGSAMAQVHFINMSVVHCVAWLVGRFAVCWLVLSCCRFVLV